MLIDINDRIAKVKGWTYEVVEYHVGKPFKAMFWTSPEGRPTFRPNFTTTLEGVAGMMRELGPEWAWAWDGTQYVCCQWEACGRIVQEFCSPDDRPGDCVGKAWLSVFGKEATDAN